MVKGNSKGQFSFRIFILLAAAIIILISGNFYQVYSGCAGDCMTCHPKLVGSEEHKSLTTCIQCHKPARAKGFSLSNSGGCGDRCFQCHNEWPKDSSHLSLNTCLNCHKK